jgi:hypothetical protein
MCVQAYLLCLCVAIFELLKHLTGFHQNGLHFIAAGLLIAAVTNNKRANIGFRKSATLTLMNLGPLNDV